MNKEQLGLILSKQDSEVVSSLQITSFPDLPKWSDLEAQYEPLQHKIFDLNVYPAKLDDNNQDDFKRTALGLQKLAVNRISQAMFSNPVSRVYNYNKESERGQKAEAIIEEIYRTRNSIDSENIERAKKLNASCQVATIWSVFEKEMIVEGEKSKFTLTHISYSEKDGYKLYPILDEHKQLLVLSIWYKDTENKEYMYVYINLDTPQFRQYENEGGWKLNQEVSKDLIIFPVVYMNIEEPVWGGQDGTLLVEQLEEMESYQGMYIKRNALPTFTLDYGEIQGVVKTTSDESSSQARRIITVGKGGSMKDVTWEGADKAINSRYERIRNAFFEQIQVPDTSFSNMIKSNTSAENKELIFADAKAKAVDLGGEWGQLFLNEMNIIMEFVKIMFPSYAFEIENMSIRTKINPYSLRTKKENAEYISLAGGAMSLETKIKTLGEVDDVLDEVTLIEEEQGRQSNQLF